MNVCVSSTLLSYTNSDFQKYKTVPQTPRMQDYPLFKPDPLPYNIFASSDINP